MSKRFLFLSLKNNVGKTTSILSMAKILGKPCSYYKPIGDRLLYKKKRLWDYDASVVTRHLECTEQPEDVTLGFEQSKLRYMYDNESIIQKLNELFSEAEKQSEYIFIEGGGNPYFGASVNVSPLALAKKTDAKLIVVVAGEHEEILDQLYYIQNEMDQDAIAGVIINKVKELEDFKESYGEQLNGFKFNILGMIPFSKQLDRISLRLVVDTLMGKVLAGEDLLNREVEKIFIGAMSVNEVLKKKYFQTPDSLVITSGDRSDIILAAIESQIAGVVLTNNIIPPSSVISRAVDAGIPLILASNDTHSVAKIIDDIEPLLNADNRENIEHAIHLFQESSSLHDIG